MGRVIILRSSTESDMVLLEQYVRSVIKEMDKIVFFEIEEWQKSLFEQGLSGLDVRCTTEKLTADSVTQYKDATIISTFINSHVTPEVLSQLPSLKLIVTRSVGYDHIDLVYCKAQHITVCNVPTYGAHT